MSSEHLDVAVDADPNQGVLLADTVVQFLAPFAATGPLSSREIRELLLISAEALPGVDSTLLLLINSKAGLARFAWQGLDGEMAEGERRTLDELPWNEALEYGAIWCEADAADHPLASLPPLEEPFADRCLLPIKNQDEWHSLLILQSKSKDIFKQWDRTLLHLMLSNVSQHIASNDKIQRLAGQLAKRTQDNAQSPPSLEGILQVSRSVLARTSPIATYLQHNASVLQGYLRTLQETIDYYLDEIKLNAPPEGIERVQNFAKYRKIKEIRSDLDALVEDSSEGIFQLRYFLDRLRELHTNTSMSEQLSFDQILDPVFPLLLSNQAIQIERPPLDDLPLYGNRTQLHQLMLMLFYTIQEGVDPAAAPPHIEITAEQVDDTLYFGVSYPTRAETPGDEAAEYLFIKRVMEEHRGTFVHQIENGIHQLTLGFPVMFSENEGEPQHFSMDALELPALESSENMAAPEHDPTERYKLLFIGTEKRFLRSLKRILSPSFDIFIAGSSLSALDVVQAHSDIALILCDLQEGADESLGFLDEIEDRDPHLVSHICFLVGEKMSPEAETLAHRVSMRTCYRHAPVKELETFIRRRTRVV